MLFECSSHPGAVSQTNRIQVAGFHFFSVVGSSHLTAALGKFCYISLGWLTNLYMHKNSFLRRRFVRFDNQLVFFVWKPSHKKGKRPKPWKAWKTLRNRNKSWKCSTTPWAWHVVPGLQKIDGHGLVGEFDSCSSTYFYNVSCCCCCCCWMIPTFGKFQMFYQHLSASANWSHRHVGLQFPISPLLIQPMAGYSPCGFFNGLHVPNSNV